MRFDVTLDLTLTTRPARVWVEERPCEDKRLAAIYRRLGEPEVRKILRWEEMGRARRVSVAEVCEAVVDVMEGKIPVTELVGRYGNFFPRSGVPTDEARAAVAVLGTFLALTGASGTPGVAALAEKWLLAPLKRYAQGAGIAEGFIAHLNGEGVVLGARGAKSMTLACVLERDFAPVWVPARPTKPKPWPVFPVPDKDKWPTTEREVVKYVREWLWRNALVRLQEVKLSWAESGGLVLRPVCLSYALLAYLFLRDQRAGEEWPSLSAADRRAVEAYFRVYRRRGKITPEQHKRAVAAVKAAWERGERDRAMLREIGWAAARRAR